MKILITGTFFHVGLISITALYVLLINRINNLSLSKYRIIIIVVFCILIFTLNNYMYILFSHGSKEGLFDDFLILQLYFNLILFTPFIVLFKKLGYLKIFIHIQGIFIIIYIYHFMITYYFYSTFPFHAGSYYWLKQLCDDIKSIPNFI